MFTFSYATWEENIEILSLYLLAPIQSKNSMVNKCNLGQSFSLSLEFDLELQF